MLYSCHQLLVELEPVKLQGIIIWIPEIFYTKGGVYRNHF